MYGECALLNTNNGALSLPDQSQNASYAPAVGKNRKENMEGLKTVQLSTVVVTLLYSTLLDDLPVKGSILLDLVFYS